MQLAAEILSLQVAGKKVAEIGCGSSLLSRVLISAGAQSYIGIDVSTAAIDRASLAAQSWDTKEQTSSQAREIMNIDHIDADIVFSLGLIDWLNDQEIDHLFLLGSRAHFLHSFSERRATISQQIHRAYVSIAYGLKTAGYRPRYFEAEKMISMSSRHNPKPSQIFRDRALNFGALLTSLPLPEK